MVRARWAKMSRISAVRSMTLRPSEPPRLRSWIGDHEVRALTLRRGPELVHLALPEIELGCGREALLGDAAHDFGAGRLGEAAHLVQGLFAFVPAPPAG